MGGIKINMVYIVSVLVAVVFLFVCARIAHYYSGDDINLPD
jgi:hypothetical protein